MELYDIVYILRDGVEPDELRYSLRSVCKNFPHRNVWFFCGKPEGITPDVYAPIPQAGIEVWQKSTSSVLAACRSKGVSEDFWLFNDDFFVLEPIEEMTPYYDKTIFKRVEQIRERHDGVISLYARELLRAQAVLEADGFKTFNYALHVPMLINKKKALEVLERYKNPMFRSLYGNYWKIGGRQMADVKITGYDRVPKKGAKFVSTSDAAFKNGKVGEYIRAQFPDPCKYED